MTPTVSQYVGEKWRWGRDWFDDLAPGATIISSTWSAEPESGVALSNDGVVGSETNVLVEATAVGSYLLANDVVFSDGNKGSAYMRVVVRPEEASGPPSPYPEPEELLASLPAGGDPLTLSDAELYRTRWINSLEFQPSLDPQTEEEKRIAALAAMVVEEGALAALYARQLWVSGQTVGAEVRERAKSARELRKEYNAMRATEEDEAQAPVAYVEEMPF